jgi:hypothetical protein
MRQIMMDSVAVVVQEQLEITQSLSGWGLMAHRSEQTLLLLVSVSQAIVSGEDVTR